MRGKLALKGSSGVTKPGAAKPATRYAGEVSILPQTGVLMQRGCSIAKVSSSAVSSSIPPVQPTATAPAKTKAQLATEAKLRERVQAKEKWTTTHSF